MQMDAKLDEISISCGRRKMAKKRRGPTPEQRAEWAAVRQRLEEHLARRQARRRDQLAREVRRRQRLRRLTFGLLGR
jgi:hypothetical protein